jgi:hypothetical protein
MFHLLVSVSFILLQHSHINFSMVAFVLGTAEFSVEDRNSVDTKGRYTYLATDKFTKLLRYLHLSPFCMGDTSLHPQSKCLLCKCEFLAGCLVLHSLYALAEVTDCIMFWFFFFFFGHFYMFSMLVSKMVTLKIKLTGLEEWLK